MSSALSIGVSALLASQRQLTTSGHNIANVNTEGYSRQRVELVARPPQFSGAGFIGKGVQVSTVARTADEFLNVQVRSNLAAESRATMYAGLTGQVDSILNDGAFSTTLDRFFSSLQDANNDPSSVPARQVFLTAAQALANGVQDLDSRFSTINDTVNDQIRQRVSQINSMSTALAGLNRDIVQASGSSQGQPPNDLLDQRDQLLKNLSQLVNVTTLAQSDGAVNVFIGNGQLLVAGGSSMPLSAVPNPLDGSRTEVSLNVSGNAMIVSDSMTGGELAGLLQFRDQVLDPSRNAVGRLAATLSNSLNTQHAAGMDLRGALGGDLFTLGSPTARGAAGNTGTISLALDPATVGNLTDSDYNLVYNGTDYVLTRLTDGSQQTLSGAGPFTVDGMVITPGGSPTAGDQYLLSPTRYLARGFDLAIQDPQKVALANPVASSASLANVGEALVSQPKVLDPADPNLLAPVRIVFGNPPTTFQINGAGPLIPYTDGGNIDVNGWRVQITGAPSAGDSFDIGPNTNGRGDNGNGLALADLRTTKLMIGGTASYQDGYSQLVGTVGAKAQQAEISQAALKVQRQNAETARDAVSGVNLDEEAANLLRFQQAYQAAAKLIQATNEIFNALRDAMR